MRQADVDLDAPERAALADALGDTPETVISVHLLRRGLCRAFVLGSPEQPRAAMLQPLADPTEPTGFGDDPADLWQLLRGLDGWTCVNVPRVVGRPLAELIAAETGCANCLREDVYHLLAKSAVPFTHPLVRRLTIGDRHLLDAAPPDLGSPGWNWGSAGAMLERGIAAGGVQDGRLVAIAFASAVSQHHADIGVATLPAWQGRGLATACSALVSTEIQATGRTPVWSAGETNLASLRVAHKIGFVELFRRVYVIPEHNSGAAESSGGNRADS